MRIELAISGTRGDVAARWNGLTRHSFWRFCAVIAPTFVTLMAAIVVIRDPQRFVALLSPALVTLLLVSTYGTFATALNWRNRVWTKDGSLYIRCGRLPWVGFKRAVFARGELRGVAIGTGTQSTGDDVFIGDDSLWRAQIVARKPTRWGTFISSRAGAAHPITTWTANASDVRPLVDALEHWRTTPTTPPTTLGHR